VSHYLVLGSSRGLGLCLTQRLLASDHHVSSISRTQIKLASTTRHNHLCLDLAEISDEDLSGLFNQVKPIDGVCFAHRYRPTLSHSYLEDYSTSVIAVAKLLDYIDRHPAVVNPGSSCRALLIGSSYSSFSGYDQDWSYHANKHALLGLLRYFSTVSSDHLLVFMVSPPTYMKEGSLDYWTTTTKYEVWKSSPARSMPSVSLVVDVCKQLICEGSPLLSGQNLILDGGMSNLYPDQITLKGPGS